MNPVRRPWSRLLVQSLTENPELVKIYVVPGLLFVLDCVLRGCFGVDLIDAGADMALLAVATFVALLVEDMGHQQQQTAITTVFIVVFLILWIICLRIVSIEKPLPIDLLWSLDFRLVLSWLVGTVTLVFSGIIANAVIQGPTDTNR